MSLKTVHPLLGIDPLAMSPSSTTTSPTVHADVATRSPVRPRMRRYPSFTSSAFSSTPMQPTFDPDTGLDLFPRLPEDEDDEGDDGNSEEGESVDSGAAAAGPSHGEKHHRRHRRKLSARLADSVALFLPKSWYTPSPPIDADARPGMSRACTSGDDCYCWSCRDEGCSSEGSALTSWLWEIAAH